MPVAGEYKRPLEEWATDRTKILRITLTPSDWRALRLLAAERDSSLHQTISDMLHDRIIEKAALIAELEHSV